MYENPRKQAMDMAISYCSSHPKEDLFVIAEKIYQFLTKA